MAFDARSAITMFWMSIKLLFVVFFPSSIFAADVYEQFPDKVERSQKYVFYSHGLIVEGTNPTPVNARWGKYEFPMIKKALADADYNLIAYHRAKNTEPKAFAQKLENDVRLLIAQGVSASNISLIGFSRGGAITIEASNLLANEKVNFVLLAACGRYVGNQPSLKMYGNVLSIYETSDEVGSCQFLIDRSKQVAHFTEIAISTSKEHGAFYTPIPQWVDPVKKWLKDAK
ncbi:alpha/beta hydrolase [Pseudoalteromonas sp. KS88]|uniref:alpha/beta hydrolase n=1 Tax=Pseudoalteromonas sp. KS88 TaxID=2109918 RepID=UPI001FDA8B8D|nr:alpha/beta hydrolase [Pseudoalteromonas sp. KS88]